MKRIAIVTDQPDRFAAFANALANHSQGAAVSWYPSGAAALEAAAASAPDLAVVEEELADLTAPAFLRRLMAINAMIHTAVASRLTPDQFHETYEGLGVLMPLRPEPDEGEANSLVDRLEALQA